MFWRSALPIEIAASLTLLAMTEGRGSELRLAKPDRLYLDTFRCAGAEYGVVIEDGAVVADETEKARAKSGPFRVVPEI